MWKQVENYYVIISENFISLIYLRNKDTRKYFGATWSMGKEKSNDKFIKKFLKIYGLPGKTAVVIKF